MNKKNLRILICILISSTIIIPTVAISKNFENLNIQSIGQLNRNHVTIYVDTRGIDSMIGLTDEEKAQLKAAILAHIWDNLNETVGAENVTVTNDPSQAANANRTINLIHQSGAIQYVSEDGYVWVERFFGKWRHGEDEVDVFLRNFYRHHPNDFKDDGVWNITKLANAIGRTAAHEVAHSYSVGHNRRTVNQSKMTDGELVNITNRASGEWHFDNHTRDVLRENWGNPPCDSATDYDRNALVMNYWAPASTPEDACEFASSDALFLYEGELAYFFEFGWLGEDTDKGEFDGDPNFDFIYKSSMSYNPYIDAEMITFIKGHSDHAQFLLRGTPSGPWAGQWFLLEQDNVDLYEFITNPSGKQIARNVDLMWDVNNDDIIDVTVTLDSLPYGIISNPYTGFTFEQVFPNHLPGKPTTPDGPPEGSPGVEYTYTFISNDPDGDSVYYYVDWGDDSDGEWFGPIAAADEASVSHIWEEKGTYKVKVMAMDTSFAESDWSDPLSVTMPRNKAVSFPFLQFLENHPILFQLLLRFLRL